MANDKFIVKNGLVSQNVDYVSPDRTQEINLELDNTGSLTWSGTNTGKIFSLSDTTSGTVFSIVDSANNEILGIGGDGSISISDSDGNALLSTSTQSLDVSGSITASSFVGDLTGNASTASTLETPRTITLSGAVTGSTTFDGSSNVTISTSATNDPTLTLSGDASGSATFTNLGDATLTVSVDGGNADTLDNQNGTYYLDYNNFTNKPSLYTSSNFDTDFASKTTDNLSEGSNNLYYTNARVDARIGNGTLTVSGASGLTGSGTFSANQSTNQTIDISHADTSTQGSVNNSGGAVIQDVTLDGYGHITNLNSVDLDLRYLQSYTETDTLDSVTDRGNNTTNCISTGAITSSGAIKSGGIFSNTNLIDENITIVSNDNAMSIGPISIATGTTVTIESGATYAVL